MTRVLIAAPSAVVRAGLEALIGSNPALELSGSFPDLSAAETVRPDVIVAAVPFKDLPPVGDTFSPALVILADEARAGWSRDAVRAGVRAVLPHHASAAEILAAIEAAAAGFATVDPRDLEELLAESSPVLPEGVPATLTARELEVLRLMAEGAANKIIAWKLKISEHTVKFHVASILHKLDAGTRAEAVAIGMRRGMILL